MACCAAIATLLKKQKPSNRDSIAWWPGGRQTAIPFCTSPKRILSTNSMAQPTASNDTSKVDYNVDDVNEFNGVVVKVATYCLPDEGICHNECKLLPILLRQFLHQPLSVRRNALGNVWEEFRWEWPAGTVFHDTVQWVLIRRIWVWSRREAINNLKERKFHTELGFVWIVPGFLDNHCSRDSDVPSYVSRKSNQSFLVLNSFLTVFFFEVS